LCSNSDRYRVLSFVTALAGKDIRQTVLLRSYETNLDRINCKVSEAAQATSAALFYFKGAKVTIDGRKQEFIDAGIKVNNPALVVHQEAEKLFGTNMQVEIFLSLGTGEKVTASVACGSTA